MPLKIDVFTIIKIGHYFHPNTYVSFSDMWHALVWK